MRIAYFSPLPPLKSGISDYSELIISELKKRAEVHVWVDGYKPVERIISQYPIIDYLKFPEKLKTLSEYDAIIYNMGNNINFHLNIFDVLQEYPGIVILHDYVMHHFFAGYWLDFKKQPKCYVKEMYLNHGQKGKELAERIINGKQKNIWETDEVFNYPLNKRVLQNAFGIVVHSHFVNSYLDNINVGTIIKKINMPFFENNKIKKISKKELGLPSNKTILFTLGNITFNKKIDIILKSISTSNYLKNNCIFVCAGEKSKQFDIKKKIIEFEIEDIVYVPGRISLGEIYDYLSVADICINLRYPTMGETSGSAIRMLHMGKPTLVTKIGWYDELPDDCVIKIHPTHNVAELQEGLENLVRDMKLRINIGNNAREYIIKNYPVNSFVQELVDFIGLVSKRFPGYNLVNKVGAEFYAMGVKRDSELIDYISKQLYIII